MEVQALWRRRRFGRNVKRSVALAAVASMVLVGLWSTPERARGDTAPADPSDPSTPTTVSADALPAPQINGVVWSQAMVGNTVYVGGSFSNARPAGSAAGQNTVARGNMLAFDVTTGQLNTSFAPTFNAQIRAIAVSPDKTKIYVGGEFTTVNGQSRKRLAAFNAQTGALITTFAPPVNYDVDALVATNTKVYAGGSFLGVGSQDRQYLAAFNASNGALLDWAPQATGGTVSAMTINPDGSKIVVGGSFTAVNGSSNPGYGLAMIDAVTGASLPFEVNSVIRNGTIDGAITTLTTDGTYVYGGGYTFGKSGGTFEGTFSASWDGGKINFINDCHGDTYSLQPVGSVVYQVGHSHYCENIDGPRQGAGSVGSYPYYRATAMSRTATGTASWEPDQGRYYSFLGQPTPSFLGWYPNINAGTYTGQSQGAWSLTGNSDYIVAGGEFTRVNNANQQGLVRFAVSSKAPNDLGPTLFNSTYPLNLSSTGSGSVRVSWMANTDADNEYLTYKVYRDTQNAAGLRKTVTQRVRKWATENMGYTDTGLSPGSTHQYRVVVSDPFGNTASSAWTNVTVAPSGTDSAYLKAVYDSQPTDLWRLGDTAGTTSADQVGFLPLTLGAGVTRGTAGAISGDQNTAATFAGTSTGWAAAGTAANPPDVFSLESWFKTTSTTGGRLVGWSSSNTGTTSRKADRQIYMDNAGHVLFGTKPTNQRLAVSSPATYNNGNWHHVVGTLSKTGLKLYVDGNLVASRTDVTVGEHLAIGYWRIGGDTLSGWPSQPTSGNFNGSLDDVAVYTQALGAGEISAHYAAGSSGTVVNQPPKAAFDLSSDGLSITADGSDSSDSDGNVASYAWTFGDGSSGTGKSVDHNYTTAGTYDVKLTVTDDQGGTDSITKSVTVAAANQPPTAAFDLSADDLSISADASDSADSDGSISSYAWTFGDGSSGTGKSVDHDYTTAGTYDVKLTVTDNQGGTDSITKSVTVSAGGVIAGDAFSRTVSSGWGSADLGGVWTRSGTATNFAVAGGVGTIRMGTAGSGPSMALNGVSATNTEVRTTISMDKAATGGGVYGTVRPRIVSNGDRYFVDTRWVAGGTVILNLGRNVGSTETNLQSRTVTGLTVAPGEKLNVKAQAFGTSPTTFRAKVWKVGTAEPSAWTASVTDSSATLQAAGAIGLGTYLSGSATNAPVVASFDDFWAGPPTP